MDSENQIRLEKLQAYVLGKLPPKDANEMRLAAERDPELAAEIALWRAARGVHAEKVSAVDMSEFGWARIERDIDRSHHASPNPNVASPLPEPANDEPFWSRRKFSAWQVAACVGVAILSWQTFIAPIAFGNRSDDPAEYVLASGDTSEQFTIRVAVAEGVSEADMRNALRDVDAHIVDGPSVIGLYTLGFESDALKAKAFQGLSDRKDIFVEIAD